MDNKKDKNFQMNTSVGEGYKNKLKGQVFKLLPLKEEKGHWEKSLDTLLIELYGLWPETESINQLTLVAKLQSLRFLSYAYYKKTIFECLSIIEKLDC